MILGHFYALIFVLLFWGGVIALIVWAIRRLTASNRGDNALNVLSERFARGEIDEKEFEARKAVLLRRQAPS
jgi:putative membrane protein